MLTKYLNGQVDLANSYVIGDRLTDLELARNLGTKGILLKPDAEQEGVGATPDSWVFRDWEGIYQHLRLPPRRC